MRLKSLFIISIILAFSFISLVIAEEAKKNHPEKTINAIRINPARPVIDGILNDEMWHKAPSSSGFFQRDPKEGNPASEDTKIQIVYDDDAIYFGVTCYDKEPNKIIARLTRRDGEVAADWVSVNIDSHHDHRTGNWFSVNAAGVLNDGQMFNDGWEDSSWNGVWEAKTSIGKDGWYAEYKIPYHVLRFSPKDEYVWGINAIRGICRKNEKNMWILVGQNDHGWISNFGHIEGIKGITPPAHLEFLPFLLGRSTSTSDNNDLFSSAGLDLRYGVTSSISLNATFNPDFGQIEADPAQLNLSAFETYLDERRPFFIEGNTIFATPRPEMPGPVGIPNLFYSRRIGKQPGMFAIPEGSELIDQPKSTTIISAVKLSGKTEKRTAFGILNAVTANEYSQIKQLEQGKQEDFRIEPMANYFVGRVQQDIMKKSTVGAMMTAVNRDDVSPAYAGEIDSHLKFGKQEYSLYTRLSGSQTGSANDRKNGYDALLYMYKFSGVFGGQFFVDARSPKFEVNDLGFMDRAGIVQSGLHLKAETQKEWKFARRASINFNAWSGWNYDSINISKGINFNGWVDLKKGYFGAGVSRDFESLDDMETRGGPLMIRPAGMFGWLFGGTDGRKVVSLESHVFVAQAGGALNRELGTGTGVNIRLASNIQLNIGPGYSVSKRFSQWVANVDDDGDGNNDHYVFGELKSQTLDFTTRLNWSWTTNMSLQLYLQPFIAIGNYSNFKELARPESYEFTSYNNLDFNPDFIDRSLRSNAVFRWEYKPGSVLFLVWSQSKGTHIDASDPVFEPYKQVKDGFSDKGDNVFLAKVSYWLGM